MKLYIKQFTIILCISFVGEILNYLIPLPIPASIYGIVIMFTGLVTKLIPLAAVRETGKFLVELMPVMFIPAGVGLMDSWGLVKQNLWSYVVITLVTTILVMGVSGMVTQAVIRMKKGGNKK